MNRLDRKRRQQVIAALIEGCSIRSIVRMTVTGGLSEIHFQRGGGDPVIHLAAGWLGPAAEKSAWAGKTG